MTIAENGYDALKELLAGRRLPCALVDLNAFWQNAERLVEPLRRNGKRLRLATKSLRVPELIQALAQRYVDLLAGFMTYTVEESQFLALRGLDDFLVAYPTLQPSDLQIAAELTAQGKTIRLMADAPAQLEALAAAGRKHNVELRAVLDLDASLRLVGGRVHLGVRRSPLRHADEVAALAQHAARLKGVRVEGLMAYEAQIAGLNDAAREQRWLNPVKRAIKRLSMPDVLKRRGRALELLRDAGLEPTLVNGGGTGSVEFTSSDPAVTEVTIGSGFFCPQLFSEYHDLKLTPAAFFALQVVRASDPGLVTCQGGGYAASGAAGPDRLPRPFLPAGLRLLSMEGAGEVQTPLEVPQGVRLAPGDPVLFRHAKAGELMEHFNETLLVQDGRVSGDALTYRGCGMSFL
ncbi:MAG: alanine racemase [Candidatus Alcyoniella australis]|nr:alanine racemase [Candidatus Alcyoniella australis]